MRRPNAEEALQQLTRPEQLVVFNVVFLVVVVDRNWETTLADEATLEELA